MKFLLFCFLLDILFSNSDTLSPVDILRKTATRMDGVNHEFSVSMENSKKKRKKKDFKVLVNWPSEGEILRETLIQTYQDHKKKSSSYWEQKFNNGNITKRWMTMPITGKLKDISHKKAGNNSFSLEELEITNEFIQNYVHTLIDKKILNQESVFVIESEKLDEEERTLGTKKLWIDTEGFFIHKAEFYTKTGRLYRSIDCVGYFSIENIQFPSKIMINNLKSKFTIHLEISNIRINPKFDPILFIPSKQ